MTDGASPDAATDVASTTPRDLYARIDAGEAVTVLDVRAAEEFASWHIDGESVETVNYPYFELLDGIPADLLADLPEDTPVTVVCAKGGASGMVVEHLREEGYDAHELADGMQGWARLYHRATIDAAVDATIVQYRRPSSGCLAYLVVSDGEAAVVDPLRTFTDEYRDDLDELEADLTYALDTHVHADHVSGVRTLADRTDATPVLPDPAVERGVAYADSVATVAHGDTLSVGTVDIEVLHTPGHTTGMTSYRVGDVLFTGDGLFTDSVARPDLEDPEAAREAARTLYRSLADEVLVSPDETVVAPAHYGDAATPAPDGTYTAPLGDLRAEMAALSMAEEEFVEHVVADMPPRPANYEAIIATNLGERSVDDERAFELELGPNNCAASEGALSD